MCPTYWITLMIYKIKRFIYNLSFMSAQLKELSDHRIEVQSLTGRIKLLEEQQEIMHNFLVEINKYLLKQTENKNG